MRLMKNKIIVRPVTCAGKELIYTGKKRVDRVEVLDVYEGSPDIRKGDELLIESLSLNYFSENGKAVIDEGQVMGIITK